MSDSSLVGNKIEYNMVHTIKDNFYICTIRNDQNLGSNDDKSFTDSGPNWKLWVYTQNNLLIRMKIKLDESNVITQSRLTKQPIKKFVDLLERIPYLYESVVKIDDEIGICANGLIKTLPDLVNFYKGVL